MAFDAKRLFQAVGEQGRLDQVIAEAVAHSRTATGAEGASLLLFDSSSGDLVFKVFEKVREGDGSTTDLREVRLPPGEGLAWRALHQGELLVVEDAGQADQFAPGCDAQTGFATGPLMALPLLLGGEPLAVLEVVKRRGAPPFTAADAAALQELGPHIGIALHDARLVAQLRTREEEVRRVNQDLESRIRARTAALTRGKREWELTFDAIELPISLQQGFVLRRVNQAYADFAGRPITELPGRRCYEVLAERSAPCPGCPLLAPEQESLRATGLPFPRQRTLDLSGFFVSPEAGDGGAVMVYRDVTAERSLEQRLRSSERMASLGQLASGAAHEINNPLGFIQANLSTLREWLPGLRALWEAARQADRALASGQAEAARLALGRVDLSGLSELLSETEDLLSESREGVGRIAEIVGSLRELSPLQRSAPEPVQVNASVQRAARKAFEGTRGPLLTLEAREAVLAAPLSLDNALFQILRNARQAIAPGGIVQVRTGEEGGFVFVEVEDNGAGIAEENLGRVFEPFFTTRGVGVGVGLGLTATFGIVQRFGGDVRVESKLGAGTTVIVRLPTLHAEAASVSADPTGRRDPPAPRPFGG